MSRRTKKSGVAGVNLGLIVVPMLDMSFQLLAFFIMVYSPNANEEFIGADLQRSKAASAKDAPAKGPKKDVPDLPSIDSAPDLEDTLIVVLALNDPNNADAPREKAGSRPSRKLKFLQIKDKVGQKLLIEIPVADDEIKLTDVEKEKEKEVYKLKFDELETKLKDLYAESVGGDKKDDKKEPKEAKDAKEPGAVKTKVRIEADPSIQFDYVIQVYAACRRANFEDVNFTTPLD